MKLIFKAFIALIGMGVLAVGATAVAIVGLVSVVMFKQAKLADGKNKAPFGTKTKNRDPEIYEPMSLEEIRAL